MTSKELMEKYPKIFRQKDLSIQETCMCWGLECSKYWFPLIDELCNMLQGLTDELNYPQVEATQVKEKFGALRFYHTYSETDKEYEEKKYSYLDGLIDMACNISAIICERCGSTNNISQTKGWIRTLCAECMSKKE